VNKISSSYIKENKDVETITLTADSIRDFQVCSFYYNQKYNLEIEVPIYAREQLSEKFEDILKKVISFFFYKRQGGITPSYNALINRWEKLWFPKDTTAYDLSIERHESSHGNLASYSNAASAALLQFYDDFVDYPGDPIMINENFLVPIGKHLRLGGTFDLMLRKKNTFQVVRWSTKAKRPPMDSFTYDFAALKLAYEYRDLAKRPAEYLFYDLGSTHPGGTKMTPSADEVKALLHWASEIEKGESPIPRRGFTTYCRGCDFDKPCRSFTFDDV